MWFYPHAEGAMSKHFGFGGCQGTEGEIAHAFNISNNIRCVNSLTVSQYTQPFGVCIFVLRILASRSRKI